MQDTLFLLTNRGLPKLFSKLPKLRVAQSAWGTDLLGTTGDVCWGFLLWLWWYQFKSWFMGWCGERTLQGAGEHCEVWRQGREMGKHRELRDECKGKNEHCALLKGEKHDFLVPDERKGNINRKWRSCCCSAYPFWAYPVYNNQWGVI